MIQFWIFSALLMGLAALFIVLPLWRSNPKDHTVQRSAANLEIFRDQVAEMDADLRNGLLTPELYEQGKRELQARVLDEAGEAQPATPAQPRNRLRLLALALIIVLPLLAVGLYWQLGNRQALLPQMSQANQATFSLLRSEAAIKQLEQKLADQPDSPEGWLLLARSYSEMERFPEAARAYDKLTQLVPNDAQLWADYADVVAMVHGQSLQGLPTRLLTKALDLDPNNGKALALSGSAAMERGDYAAAVRYWENLLKLIPPDTEGADMVASGIKQARAFMQIKGGAKPMPAEPKAAGQQPAAAGAERISGTVTLSEKLKAKVSPEDTVFVLVRAAQGPKMPLAIIRKQVKDLPLKFTLDDSMAMSPQMKMSSFDQLVVIARISKSGDAMPRPGDMQGISTTLKPGSQAIKLNIDTLLQ
ncbi:MAG TPA: c-type cytochrome biogenesis protein CcmI [Gallionellaceae bacterium]|nr:c-type cytochrome biogenesis protein CcmI [Gallionellaceae bacterium]